MLDLRLGSRFGSTEHAVAHSLHMGAAKQVEYFALASMTVPLQHFFFAPDARALGMVRAGGAGASRGANLTKVRLKEAERGNSEEQGAHEPAKDLSDARAIRGAETDANTGKSRRQAPVDENAPAAKKAGSSPHRRDFLHLVRETMKRVRAEASHAARLSKLVSRSRLAGWVPELRLRGVYGFDRTVSSEEAQGIYPGETTTRGARDSLVEARLTFRLDRLVFGDGEAGIERQRGQLAAQASKTKQRALELLFTWRKAETLIRAGTLFEEEELELVLKSEQALAELHVLTKGWFQGIDTANSLSLVLFDEAAEDVNQPRKGELSGKPQLRESGEE